MEPGGGVKAVKVVGRDGGSSTRCARFRDAPWNMAQEPPSAPPRCPAGGAAAQRDGAGRAASAVGAAPPPPHRCSAAGRGGGGGGGARCRLRRHSHVSRPRWRRQCCRPRPASAAAAAARRRRQRGGGGSAAAEAALASGDGGGPAGGPARPVEACIARCSPALPTPPPPPRVRAAGRGSVGGRNGRPASALPPLQTRSHALSRAPYTLRGGEGPGGQAQGMHGPVSE